MTDLKDAAAAELADALITLGQFRHSTSGASALDEAAIAFDALSPGVAAAHAAFARARMAHVDSYKVAGAYTDSSWSALMATAEDLAGALRMLGDVRAERCKRRTGWGTCNLPLGSDGECRYPEHTD